MGDAGDMFKGVITACIIAGVGIGFVLFVGIPFLWKLVKPFIHMITA